MNKLIHYPKCTTCQKAKKYLDQANISYIEQHIKEDKLTKEEIIRLHKLSKQPLKKFFNTSGILYRELGLKDKLPTMSEDEQYDLLASDGMLVKRPLFVTENEVLIGFKEKEYAEIK